MNARTSSPTDVVFTQVPDGPSRCTLVPYERYFRSRNHNQRLVG